MHEAVKRVLLEILELIERGLYDYPDVFAEVAITSMAFPVENALKDQARACQMMICERCSSGEALWHFCRQPAWWHKVSASEYEDCPASVIIDRYDLGNQNILPLGTGINAGAYPPAYPQAYPGVPSLKTRPVPQELLEFRICTIIRQHHRVESHWHRESGDRAARERAQFPWMARFMTRFKELLSLQSANERKPQPTNEPGEERQQQK
jgi:hypothetical protein